MTDYPVKTIQKTGSDTNRIDIVILGDGYTASEIDTAYAQHVQSFLSYLFGTTAVTAPFGRYANFFNVYRVDVVSNQSGADDPASGTTVDTALGASYKWDGVTDRLLYVDYYKAMSVFNSALAGTGIHPNMEFVSVNATKYGGGGGNFAVFAGGNQSAAEIALHEVGHSFAHLADEYWTDSSAYSGGEPSQPDVTKDATGAKWSKWIGYDDPILGKIGAYQGGLYCQTGVYRPSQNSKMRSLGQPFDAIAREQFILDFYSIVHPLDSYTANAVPIVDPTALLADTIDPGIIHTCWTVDGATLSDANLETFSLTGLNLSSGSHAVSVFAYDPTDWVRGDRSLLQQRINWTVEFTHAIMHASAGHQVLTGGSKVDEMYGTDGADTLSGAAGNDTLNGGLGNDVLDGGTGIDIAVFSGNRAAYTITRGAGGMVTVTGTDGTDTLTRVEYAKFADQTVLVAPVARDFDGDGKSDILWYDANTGQDMIWLMDGTTRLSMTNAGGAQGAEWKIISTGDFNGDGKADILWEDTARGQDMIWLMNGATRTTMAAAGGSQGSVWKIIGTGDFDGDGKSDILWEDTTRGQDMIWLMNGTTRTSMTAAGGSQGSQWKIIGTGDFNGDGKSDILWEDTTRGQDMIWLMNGNIRTSMTAAGGSQGAEWKIAGTGDFDGDGKSDILWQNTNTGQDMIWLMDGTTRRSMASAGGPQGAGWNIIGTGDYNSDGKSDILWEYTPTGQDMVWLMDGTTRLSKSNVGGAQGSSWLIVGSC